MPTSHDVTPRRVLSFILTIPLLLLFLSVRPMGPFSAVSPGSSVGCRGGLSHRLPIPVPWEDDVLKAGLPAAQHVGKRSVRKIVSARVLSVERPKAVARGFLPGPPSKRFSRMRLLSVSLLLGRPPPADSPPERSGGREGNEDIQHFMA
jgi:hypothetical protein